MVFFFPLSEVFHPYYIGLLGLQCASAKEGQTQSLSRQNLAFPEDSAKKERGLNLRLVNLLTSFLLVQNFMIIVMEVLSVRFKMEALIVEDYVAIFVSTRSLTTKFQFR